MDWVTITLILWLIAVAVGVCFLRGCGENLPPRSTKQCKCGNKNLVCISTHQQKRCTDCGNVIEWTKEEGESDYV